MKRSQLMTLALGVLAVLACSACILGQASFSPDDTKVAVVVFGVDASGEERSELWVTDVATLESEMVIADKRLGASTAWSRAGGALHYSLRSDDGDRQHLERWDGEESSTVATYELDDDFRVVGLHPPAFSPDGRFVYLTRTGDTQDTCTIVRHDTLGGETASFRKDAAIPVLSPDGKHLACVLLSADERPSLAVLSTGSGEPVATAPARGKLDQIALFLPAWSRDGKRVAFVDATAPRAAPSAEAESDSEKRTELVVLDLATGEFQRAFTAAEGQVGFPLWGAQPNALHYNAWTKGEDPPRAMRVDVSTREVSEVPGGTGTFLAGISHDGKTLALRVLLSQPDAKRDSGGGFDVSHLRLLDLSTGSSRDVIVSAFQLRAIARTAFERAIDLRASGDASGADAALAKGARALDKLFTRFADDVAPGDRLARAAARAGIPPTKPVDESK